MLKSKRHDTKSFFYEMFRNFILLLIVPMITILLIFNRADDMVREQIQESSSKDFSLYYEQMEDIVNDMQSTCLSVLADADCKTYSLNLASDSNQAQKLKKNIYQFLQNMIGSRYHDIFVYFERDDRCVSGRYTSLTAERYYDAYYGDLRKETYSEEFLEILDTATKKSNCHVFRDYLGKEYLCMTMKYPVNLDTSNGFTVCVVLSPEYLKQSLIMPAVNEDDIFLIYNESQKLILNSRTTFIDRQMIEQLQQQENQPPFGTWVNKQEYMIQMRPSETLKNTYVYVIPSKSYWNAREQLRLYCWVGIGICMIISILFTYRSVKKTYHPIGNIVELIRNKESAIGNESESQHEFAYITSYIKASENRIAEYKHGVQEWCLYNLLEGRYEERDKEMLAKHNIFFPHSKYAVCLLQIEDVGSDIEDLYLFIIKNVFEELGNTEGKAYLVDFSKKRCVLLINLEGSTQDIDRMLEEGQKFLKQFYQIIVTIGLSNTHQTMTEIAEAYREAQEAVRYRFLMGLGRRISYEGISRRTLTRQGNGESKIYMLLQDFIKEEREAGDVESFVESLVYIYEVNEEVSIDVANYYKKEVITALSNVMARNKYGEEQLIEIAKELKATDTLTAFQQRLSFHIANLCEQCSGKNAEDDILARTKEYITANYSDNQLSVAKIGKKMGIQPARLSKLFKETYGMSMLDYIASVRIHHAKRIIREQNLSVEETAEKVGFIDSNAFIRIFKKLENITPGKYKKSCEESDIC